MYPIITSTHVALLASVHLFLASTSSAQICPPTLSSGKLSQLLNPGQPGTPPSSTWPVDLVQNYGETRPDDNPLVDWSIVYPNQAPLPCFNPGWTSAPVGENWSVPGLTPGKTYDYQRRIVRFDSGAWATIFAPCPTPPVPVSCTSSSACTGSYDRDAVFFLAGTHGDPYRDFAMPDLGIGAAAGLLGKTIGGELVPNGVLYEALQRGHTVVVPEFSLGGHPFLWSFSEIVEIDRWLNSRDYHNPPLKHRNFAYGGSYGGVLASNLAIWFPWLFRGAISGSFNPDPRQVFSVQDMVALHSSQMSNVYNWGALGNNRYDEMMFGELNKGWSGTSVCGAGDEVDLGGLGLLCQDLLDLGITGADNFASLTVPLIYLRGDEDLGHASFSAQDITQNPSIPAGVVVKNLFVPTMGHGDSMLFTWNQTNQVYGQLMTLVAAGAGACADPASPGDIQWAPKAATTDPFRSAQLNAYKTKAAAPVTNPAFTVTPVWQLKVTEGLGVNGSMTTPQDLITGDGGQLEFATSTAGGDVVMLRIVPAQLPQNNTVQVVWRTSVSSLFGNSEVVLVPQGGTQRILALHQDGPFVQLDPTTGAITDTLPAAGPNDPGTHLRYLAQVPGASPYFEFVNAAGELVKVADQGALGIANTTTRTIVEGGVSHFVPLNDGSGNAVYSSAHGNLKRYALDPPSKLLGPNDTSNHLETLPSQLLVTSNSGALKYLALSGSLVFGIDANLGLLWQPGSASEAQPVTLPAIMTYLNVDSTNGSEVWLIGSGADAKLYWIKLTAATGAIASSGSTSPAFSSAIGAARKLPSSPIIRCKTEAGVVFIAQWVTTLHNGQVLLVGDLFTNSPKFQVLAGDPTLPSGPDEPFGSAFGFVKSAGGQHLLVTGPPMQNLLSRVWEIDPWAAGNNVVLQATNPSAASCTDPLRNYGTGKNEAVIVNGYVYGTADGVATLPGCNVIAFNLKTPIIGNPPAFAGIVVGTLGTCNPMDNLLPFTLTWNSERITTPEPLYIGSSVKWADIDGAPPGSGVKDLVGGAFGGQVLWYKNTGTNIAPTLPAGGVATGKITTPASLAELGIGLVGMEIADLETEATAGFVGDEILVGTTFSANESFSGNERVAGSIFALDKLPNSNALVVIGKKDLGAGVRGIRHVDLPQIGTAHDILAGTSTGELVILSYDPSQSDPALKMTQLYKSAYIAPMLGAYNSIATFQNGNVVRVVVGSSSGIFAYDITPVGP